MAWSTDFINRKRPEKARKQLVQELIWCVIFEIKGKLSISKFFGDQLNPQKFARREPASIL